MPSKKLGIARVEVAVMGGETQMLDMPDNATHFEVIAKSGCDTGLVIKLNGKTLEDMDGKVSDGDRYFVTQKASLQ